MGKNIRKNINLLILTLFIAFIAFGCGKNNIEEIEEKSASMNKPDKDTLQILERSENISDVIVDLIGVENASTILFNDVAMVSVKIYDEYEEGLTEDMKASIKKIVLENDKAIKDVLITEDEQVFNEIEEIISSLLKGEHIKEHTDDMNKLLEKMNKK